ncbi:MAG: FAD-binding oxidoreductase [Acidobacteriia bacterium]|nr:FAD-binding oxidoreductase [Terriglobia bacterium]
MAFDTIIAGAGIIGSSIAWRLAQQGLRVLLVDAGRMGAEASSAGAGMLAPGGEIDERLPWNDLALESLHLYPAFVAELEEESGCRIDFQRLGAIELALSGTEWTELEARGQRQAAFGIPSCPLTRSELRQHAPLARQDVAGALFYPQDAVVDPRDMMTALRAACLAHGVEIREGVRVTAIRPHAGAVRMETAAAVFEAPAAVIAAGAWSSQIAVEGQTLPRAFPVRGHLIGYPLAPHSLGPLLRRGHTYLLQRNSGFTVAGTSSEQVGFDRTLDPAILADIHARASELLPAVTGLLASQRWVGFRPAVDGRLALGRAANTAVWLAYGHYRNGILMAPGTAQRVAQGIIASSGTGSSALPGRP